MVQPTTISVAVVLMQLSFVDDEARKFQSSMDNIEDNEAENCLESNIKDG